MSVNPTLKDRWSQRSGTV